MRDVLAAGCVIDEGLYTPGAVLDPATAAVLEDLRAAGVPLEEVGEAEFRGFAGTKSPRGVLVVSAIPRQTLADVVGRRLAVLDAVQDPGNVGTLIRAADALGASAVVVLPGTADPWSPKCVRAAAGAGFRLPVVELVVPELAGWCRSNGVPLLAASASGEPAPRSADATDAALVFGNEGAGVSDAVLEVCDRLVAIPQRGPADSLNVAMAGAILMDRYFGG